MNSMKCRNCGLSNFGNAAECRRCGAAFASGKRKPAGKRPPRFTVASLIVYAAIALCGYYLYSAIHNSIAAVDADDAYRVGSQPPQRPATQGLTRNEADRQHANGVGDAISRNPAIEAQKQHNEETRQAMHDASR